ncbi:hypothetical protein [Pararhizobium gei]|uniref:hypothetical protein n=1 Tax=Pararhizobium gei TaxID=1395951 RepID=UPI0023DC5B43|nr:hypothetical protein [Rhizobium gei]
MIEFVLLFALGFLTAAILGLLVAPAVHRRIIRFAEDRLKATMPLSPQEVRAQKDAARAGYAAENARTSQTLKRERDKNVALMIRNGEILKEAQRLGGENADLHTQLADMNVEAADLRSAIRQMEQTTARLKSSLTDVERDNVKKAIDIKTLTRQIDHLGSEIDGMRIDAAAHQTETEHLKSRIAGLRDEREGLRNELKAEATKAREMEARLAREETRIRQFETKLAREIASNADKENALERRAAEIDRLRSRLKESGADLRQASKALRAGALEQPNHKIDIPATPQDDTPLPEALPLDANVPDEASLAIPAEYARTRATALAERLINSKNTTHDDAMREEMADIAATLVALTARKEGTGSPIPGLVASKEAARGNGNGGLASRIRSMLPPEIS